MLLALFLVPAPVSGQLHTAGDVTVEPGTIEHFGTTYDVEYGSLWVPMNRRLSGGEQQRVAIARALAVSPSLVLADEPTGNLDPATGTEVFTLLRELQSERPFALVLATHSERLARGCDRLARLDEGRLRELSETETRDYFEGLGA